MPSAHSHALLYHRFIQAANYFCQDFWQRTRIEIRTFPENLSINRTLTTLARIRTHFADVIFRGNNCYATSQR